MNRASNRVYIGLLSSFPVLSWLILDLGRLEGESRRDFAAAVVSCGHDSSAEGESNQEQSRRAFMRCYSARCTA